MGELIGDPPQSFIFYSRFPPRIHQKCMNILSVILLSGESCVDNHAWIGTTKKICSCYFEFEPRKTFKTPIKKHRFLKYLPPKRYGKSYGSVPLTYHKGSSTICWEVFQDDYDINDVATKVEAVCRKLATFFPYRKITREISGWWRFQRFFGIFIPKIWGRWTHFWRAYFSKGVGLKPPTRNGWNCIKGWLSTKQLATNMWAMNKNEKKPAWQFCWWPFWDFEICDPFNGYSWPPMIGDQKVTNWITWWLFRVYRGLYMIILPSYVGIISPL